MGFLNGWRDALAMAEAVESVPVGFRATSESTLTQLDPVAARAFGVDGGAAEGRITRDLAMQVPAVRRGRALIAATIGTLPLVCVRTIRRGDDVVVEPVDRPLLGQLDPRTTPAFTLTWTVDDLMFNGRSWWRVTDRETVGGERIGYPTRVERIDGSRVGMPAKGDRDQRITIDGDRVEDRDVIRFDGPDEGILVHGGPTIRLARALIAASTRVAKNDVPFGMLRPVEGGSELLTEPGSANDPNDPNASEVDAILAAWEAARRDRSTAYANRAIEYQTVAFNAQERQLNELQQLVDSQLARLLNLPASRIGAPQGSGMTYANVEADRRDLVDTTLAHYLVPIFQRLSMPDVTPAGQAVTFDLTAYLRGDTAQLVAAGTQALGVGAITLQEFRTRWLGLPPLPADQLPPSAPTTGDPA